MKVETSSYPHKDETLQAAFRVRDAVFSSEQGIDRSIDFDGLDQAQDVVHAVVFDGIEPVATGRVVLKDGTGRVGRVAVLKEYRGQGLGALVMEHLERLASIKGVKDIELHAQKSAAAFYKKIGYEPFGDEYLEAGIPHQSMRKALV